MVKNTKSSAKSLVKKSGTNEVVSKASAAAKSAKVSASTKPSNKASLKTEKVANFKRNRMIVIAVLVISFIGIPSFLYGRSAYEKHQDKQKFMQLAEDIEKLKTDIEKQYGIKVTEEKECHYSRAVYFNGVIECSLILKQEQRTLSSQKIVEIFDKAKSLSKVRNGNIAVNSYLHTKGALCSLFKGSIKEGVFEFRCGGNAKDFYYQKID